MEAPPKMIPAPVFYLMVKHVTALKRVVWGARGNILVVNGFEIVGTTVARGSTDTSLADRKRIQAMFNYPLDFDAKARDKHASNSCRFI